MPASRPQPARVAEGLVRSFIRLWLVSVAIVVVAALMVDPLAQFGTGLVPPMTPNTRADRAARADATPMAPDCLILGSSRIMGINPARLEKLLPAGTRCVNAGVFSATVEDLVVQYSLWSQHGRAAPRYLFIGVEQRMFHPTLPTDESLVLDRRLRRHLSPESSVQSVVEAWMRAVFGADTLEAALRTLAMHTQPLSEPRFTFDDRGTLHWTRWENQIQRTGHAPGFLFEQNVQSWIRWHAGYGDGSNQRWQHWHSLLRQVSREDLYLVVFMPPEEGRLRERVFADLPRAAESEGRWARKLEGYFGRAEGRWLDLRDAGEPGEGSMDSSPAFYDGIHPRPDLVEAMTLRLADAVP